MRLLIVGGAGYIGSHMVKLLCRQGIAVTVFDNLATGYRDAIVGGHFIQGDLANRAQLDELFQQERFDGVMHFASFIQVGESVSEPARYYQNNVSNTLNLLDTMRAHAVRRFIFSSSAAVYGEPQYTPIDESHPCRPLNPYGRSKWMIEQILADYDQAYDFKSVCLRYFNAAGADPEAEIGERHEPETHLIPLVLQAATGRREHITVFGTDYPTPDGTCIRDYIHVNDLCDAHLLALHHLQQHDKSAVFNLGNGSGFSVKQVIETARAVTGRRIPLRYGARRAGDPARLVAAAERACAELHWRPRYRDLAVIIDHAWRWERGNAGL